VICHININVADIRAQASMRSERVSQGLYNELVEIIEEGQMMSRVRFLDGYEGWTGTLFLNAHEGFDGDGPYTVKTCVAPAFEKADESSKRLTFIPYNCGLYGESLGDFLKVSSSRYGELLIPLANLISRELLAGFHQPTAVELRTEADRFLGTPYLWGGRSFFGMDCSGFSKTIMQRFGVALPRDTKDQIKSGKEIERQEIRSGDLLFFPRHVALAITSNLFVHSSQNNGGVAYNSLDSGSPIYSSSLDESFIVARRVFD
jgi:hypothetical protein